MVIDYRNICLEALLAFQSSKSIIVIEDIDCSLDLTGQRKEKKEGDKEDDKDPVKKMEEEKKKKKGSEELMVIDYRNICLEALLAFQSSKSIIVIEDIDCSLDLTGQRKEKKEGDKEDDKDPVKKMEEEKKKKKGSEVTLSGLLNFIDGLWSACGSERLIVFTTNHLEKLDPALIRRGRMDKHIEMSYCCFETFKVLAKNYLDLESHELFETIDRMLGETEMTPADSYEDDAGVCLKKLIMSLEDEKEKEAARLKALEDDKIKALEEEGKNKKEDDVKLANNVNDANKIHVIDAKENDVISNK
ncbi:hypothetical protein R6Q59_023774 [Mikania micrantha]